MKIEAIFLFASGITIVGENLYFHYHHILVVVVKKVDFKILCSSYHQLKLVRLEKTMKYKKLMLAAPSDGCVLLLAP